MPEIEKFDNAFYLPSTGGYENPRTPNIFKSTNGAGGLTIWTPTAGKRFRLMGLQVYITADAAISGGGVASVLTLNDAAATVQIFRVWIPTTSVVTNPGNTKIVDWSPAGNGYLSAAINQNCTMAITGVLTSGVYTLNAWGTEE